MLSSLEFTHNPVTRAELKYQWHIIENGRAGTIWIIMAFVLLVPAAIASLIFFVGGILNQFIPGGLHPLPDNLAQVLGGVGATLLVAMNLALYLVLTMITLGLSSNSISREKRGKTWDNLLLTGVDAGQIVWGKWWATLAALWGDHAAAAFLRLGIVAWGVAVMGGEALYQPIIPFLPVMLSYIVAGALLLVGYAIVDAALTAALGLIIPLTRFDNAAAFVVVFVVRLFLTLTPFVFPVLIFTQYEQHFASFYIGFWTIFLFVLAALTWGVLRLAQAMAVRQHASPPADKSG
jgi:hypothetical protein